jgi:hypothetical protein
MGISKRIHIRNTFIFAFIFNTFFLQAQDKSYVSASLTPGFLLAHRADIKNLAAHNFGIDISIERQKYATDWGQFYNKPSTGFGILYYNLGRVETGHALGALSHVKLNVLSIKNIDLKFRMGVGVAYLTQKFDEYENRRNQAIGSHLNGSMQFGLTARKEWEKSSNFMEAGISISHYSNAAFKVPNLGYNIPSFCLRYGWYTKPGENPSSKQVISSDQFSWSALLIYGRKQRNFANPKDFNNYGIQLRGVRHLNSVKAWRFGLDYTLDKTYMHALDSEIPSHAISIEDQSELAIAGGFQWGFGKATVIAEMGAYVYKPSILKNGLSQRMGLSYMLNQHWYTQGMLRFHRGVADFFEMGIGYTL